MRFTRLASYLLSGLLGTSWIIGPAPAAAQAVVDVRQAAALQGKGALLLDVREPDEYAQAHAPGATLIPLGQLSQRLHEIAQAKDQTVALICRSGRRSEAAQQLLARSGFRSTVNVQGGMIAWQQAGLPVVSGSVR